MPRISNSFASSVPAYAVKSTVRGRSRDWNRPGGRFDVMTFLTLACSRKPDDVVD